MKELKRWVETYFGAITNKNAGPQDFSKVSLVSPKLSQPWAGNEHEMLFG